MRARVLVGAVAVATLTVAGCASGQTAESAATPTPAQPTASPEPSVGAEITVAGMTTTYHGTADVTGTPNVTINMQADYFEPTVIRGNPGQELVLNLENTTEDAHTFTTANGLADIEVKPRSVAEGKITLPASGNLAFFDRLDNDRAMAGVFTVSGPLDDPGPTANPQTS
jgi:hypothetical protein